MPAARRLPSGEKTHETAPRRAARGFEPSRSAIQIVQFFAAYGPDAS
jgi:hypothetical protein